MPPRRVPTTTSAFGVGRRESHDSSAFYSRFAEPETSPDSSVEHPTQVNQIVVGDSRQMDSVATNSVALVVTSPPYFAGKEYEEALGEGHIPATYLAYLEMLTDVFAECVRVLEPGGRLAVNVANLGRKPYRSLSADIIGILQDRLRLLMRGEIVWRKARGAGGNCAWGSFQRPANPVLRDLTERIVVASKGRFDRALSPREREAGGLPSVSSLSRDEFMDATTDVWDLAPESARRVGHPAPFPAELPERLINLYTYYDDLVLDPFMGSGTTAIAAVRTGRNYFGYDTDPKYVEAAEARIADEIEAINQGNVGRDEQSAQVVLLPTPKHASKSAFDEAVADGRSLKELAKIALGSFELAEVSGPVKIGPVDATFAAIDASGHRWIFDVCGGRTITPSGLNATDQVLRSIGKASVIREIEPSAKFILITWSVPEVRVAPSSALGQMTGPGRPITAIVNLADPRGLDQIREIIDG